MKTDLDVSTQAQAACCQKALSCSSGRRETICKVTELMLGEALMIQCGEKLLCHYKESFGSWAICTCSTRKELYIECGI